MSNRRPATALAGVFCFFMASSSVPQADDSGPGETARPPLPQVVESAQLPAAPLLGYLWNMQLEAHKTPAEGQPDHFPCGEPATRGSFTLASADFKNLDGPEGRAAQIVQRLGLEKFCRETELSRATARRIRDRGLTKTAHCWVAVIACLKKHRG